MGTTIRYALSEHESANPRNAGIDSLIDIHLITPHLTPSHVGISGDGTKNVSTHDLKLSFVSPALHNALWDATMSEFCFYSADNANGN